MNFHSLTVSMGWIAVTFGIVGTLAQYRRVRVKGVEGVSLATWVLFSYLGCFWVAYGLAAHSIEVVAGSVTLLPIQLSIVRSLRPWTRWIVPARALGYFVLCCVAPTMLWGWAGGVYGAAVAMTITRAPQLIELVRSRDASGVSASSWYVGVVGLLCWVVYYTGAHLWAALISTSIAGLASLVIALLATWRHAQADQPASLREALAV